MISSTFRRAARRVIGGVRSLLLRRRGLKGWGRGTRREKVAGSEWGVVEFLGLRRLLRSMNRARSALPLIIIAA